MREGDIPVLLNGCEVRDNTEDALNELTALKKKCVDPQTPHDKPLPQEEREDFNKLKVKLNLETTE